MLAIPEPDGRFRHSRSTDFESITWASLGATLATGRYKERSEGAIAHRAICFRGGE